MSRAQRFAFLGIAVVIAIVAVVLLADSSEDDSSPPVRTSETPTATADSSEEETPTPTPTATPTPEPPPLLTGGKVTRLEFKEGDTVRFRVRSDVPEEVHVHGYNIARDLEPGKTTTVSFKGTIPGIFEIEFEDSGEQIAELRVEP